MLCHLPHQQLGPCLDLQTRARTTSKKWKNARTWFVSQSSETDQSLSTNSYIPPLFVLSEALDRKAPLQEFIENEKQDRESLAQDNKNEEDNDAYISVVPPDHKSGYVALVGKPNVGKSTLMNRMLGQKLSIVTHKPQTTRHRILGICSDSHYQMILYDTPGVIAKHMHKLDEMMMRNVRTAALNADCVLVIASAADTPQKVMDMVEEGAESILENRPALLVLNKKDLVTPEEAAKKVKWYQKFGGIKDVLPISAKYGHGIDELKEWIVEKLPFGPAYYSKDDVSDQPEKFFAAEIVREKLFLQYKKEIPYACQVNVIRYIERAPPAKDFIEIEIVCEKDSQKAILLGKEGSAMKTLATAARLDIEDFTGRKVYLEMKVKVKKDWRANESLLKRYGYSGQVVI